MAEEKENISGTNSRISLKTLFTDDGKDFSFRTGKEEEKAPIAKDWKQISFDFLNHRKDIEPFGPMDSYSLLDTTRCEEFVAGHGVPSWGTLRKATMEDSRDKKRKAKK
ncbi:hypothetical protein GPJ56_005635 [Histomonas meleagridis]|uniref:uncharacterized protein n=1 Tax=Histomonas meleagridis TaxID=135588 RepID=UPI00355AAC03|nr:hypothetical protein GPJ56_005635 [Histomonas meleagridis]KAH0803430.1 hypothetical protein GO595_003774 [Histomonas meleagridis]